MTPRRGRHLSIELVGPPGVGKSSIVRALFESDESMRLARLRHWWTGPYLIAHALALARPFLHQCPRMEGHRVKRFTAMVELETLGTLMDREVRRRAGCIVFDQGPVYMLSILQRARRSAESDIENHPAFERYWEATISDWSRRLDAVIALEAAPDVLRDRVHKRPGHHVLASTTPEQTTAFLERSRTSREKILQALGKGNSAPTVHRLRTDELTIEQTVKKIRDLVGLSPICPRE